MVYIDAFSHAKITQNNNANMRLSFENDNAIFSDFNENLVHCKKDENIKYDTAKQDIMLDYNRALLGSKKS